MSYLDFPHLYFNGKPIDYNQSNIRLYDWHGAEISLEKDFNNGSLIFDINETLDDA